MKAIIFAILLTCFVLSCNIPNINSGKIDKLQSLLEKKGVVFDSNFKNKTDSEKLTIIIKELELYSINTTRYTKSVHKSSVIKIDSLYIGGMLLGGYNSNLKYKLFLNYNNKIEEIPFDENKLYFHYRLKPYKIGENVYSGYILYGQDSFPFAYKFQAIK